MPRARGLRFVLDMVMLSPVRSVTLILLVLAAGIAEGIGIAAFLPILTAAGVPTEQAGAIQIIDQAMAWLGIQPDVVVLLPLVALIFVVKGGLVFGSNVAIGYSATAFGTRQRRKLMRGLLSARWSYLMVQPVGVFANVITTDTTRGTGAYMSTFRMIAEAIQVGVYFVIALAISPPATGLAGVGGAAILVSMSYLVVLARRAGADQQHSFRSLVNRLVDQFGGIKPIKAMGAEGLVAPFFEKETQRLDQSLRRGVFSQAALVSMQEPLVILLICTGTYAAVTVFALDIGTVVVLALVFYRAASKINKMQTQYQKVAVAEPFVRAVMEQTAAAKHVREPRGNGIVPELKQGIELEGVSLAYGDNVVLDSASMRIEAGHITALIGPSGSGKTTLVDLVVGLIQPQAGRVLIDGRPLADLDVARWRRIIGYVPQELALFNDTVLANITLGDTEIGRAEAQEALRAAEALSFVEQLPHGLDTRVGERGAKLSGGQRQRISLARALAHNPSLLVLDEPTTALDPAAEQAFCRTLRSFAGKLSMLVISHQPALTEIADTVYLVADGRVQLPPA